MSTAFRSVVPLLRTTRHGLKAAGRASPLQSAIKRRNASGILNVYRTYAVFERTKPHVNIGTAARVA